MKHLENKIVVIAGSSGGIGSAVVESLRHTGCCIVCVNRSNKNDSGNSIANVHHIISPLGTFSDWENIIREISLRFGAVDIFINCIGAIATGDFEHQKPEEIERVFQANFTMHMYGIKAVLPVMKSSGGGHIIEITSLGGIVPMPFAAAYSASKFAMRGLLLSVREELRGTGINLSVIAPGPVDTGMLRSEARNKKSNIAFVKKIADTDSVAKKIIRSLRFPRITQACEFLLNLPAVLFTASPGMFHALYPVLSAAGRVRKNLYRKSYLRLK